MIVPETYIPAAANISYGTADAEFLKHLPAVTAFRTIEAREALFEAARQEKVKHDSAKSRGEEYTMKMVYREAFERFFEQADKELGRAQ